MHLAASAASLEAVIKVGAKRSLPNDFKTPARVAARPATEASPRHCIAVVVVWHALCALWHLLSRVNVCGAFEWGPFAVLASCDTVIQVKDVTEWTPADVREFLLVRHANDYAHILRPFAEAWPTAGV